MAAELLIWWLVLQMFGLLAVPVAAFLFAALPDRGYAFSKSLGLLLVGYGAWLLAMLGLGGFGVPLVLLVLLVLAGLDVALLRRRWGLRFSPVELVSRLVAVLRRHWRGLLAYELLFAVALVGLAWMRAHSVGGGFVGPDPWGTERPMDFAFFNSIRYGSTLPPADPWLAGFSINYYYFGYLLMAMIAMFSGLEPSVAYNLSLAAIFALAALGVAGIVANLVALFARQRTPAAAQQDTQATRFWLPGWVRCYVLPMLGVVLVLLASNQAGALQVIVGDHRVVALDGPQLVQAVGGAFTSGGDTIELSQPVYTPRNDLGTFETLERGDRLQDFNWWWPSRALWDTYETTDPAAAADTERRYTITEFPFFSFWLGDMHPHVMALPFNLLALALALTTVVRSTLPRFGQGQAGWLDLLLTGVILGSLYTINSWDLPTYVLLYLGALLLLYARLAVPSEGIRWRHLAGQALLAVLALFLLFLPFHLTFQSLVGFKEPLIDVPILGRFSQILGLFLFDKSGLHTFLIIFGLFALPLVAFVTLLASRAPAAMHERAAQTEQPANQPDREQPAAAAGGGTPLRVGQSGQGAVLLAERAEPAPRRAIWDRVLSPWLPLGLLLVGLLVGFPLLALAGVAVVAFYQALQRATLSTERFVLLVVALGCAICFGTELVYIRDVFEGNSARMNTIFKFYYQVWLLWGTVTPFAIWWLLERAIQPGAVAERSRLLLIQRAAVGGVVALFVLFLAGSLVYPVLNLGDVAQEGVWRGLEGRTPREGTPAGQAATQWIRENVPPDAIVLEMVGPGGGSYSPAGHAGISASTGRPTLLGWVGHQNQWRGGDAVARAQLEPRRNNVERIYATTDPAEARDLLQMYDVRYVYVGQLERQAYSAESLAKFAQLGDPVFQQGEVTIYRIRP